MAMRDSLNVQLTMYSYAITEEDSKFIEFCEKIKDMVKKELSKREHLPNKLEKKEIRKAKQLAKQNR
jgi:hypothetical protein